MITQEQQEKAKEMLRTEVKAYFDVRDELGLSKEEYYELIKLDVNEWRIRARGKIQTPEVVKREIQKRLDNKAMVETDMQEVARELRCVPSSVVRLFRLRGYTIPAEGKMFTEAFRNKEVDSQVCRLHDLGLPVSLIMVEMKYRWGTPKSYDDILRDYGKSRAQQVAQELHINSHVFNFVDNEEKAYWLGMLMTDGWIHKAKPAQETHSERYQIGLSLKMSEWDVLEKFKKFVGSQREIQIKTNQLQSGEYRDYGSLIIESKIMFNDLQRYGVVERKSSNTKPNLTLIPRELQRHFWRGCYDGDGGLYYGSAGNLTVTYVGDIDIVYKLIAHLYHNQIIDHFRTPTLQDKSSDIAKGVNATVDMFEFKFAHKKDVYKILEYFYEGATIYMDRKQKFWEELKIKGGKDKC